MKPMLEVRSLVKYYQGERERRGDANAKAAVDNVDLVVESGEFFTLLGPSGCGKTTTLRSIAGLETPDSGEIRIGDTTVFGKGTLVPIYKRDIAMVFQSYAIWPHMTVRQNVAFPLRAARVPKKEMIERVNEALRMVHLEEFADRPATALSGGQQQRVAFARAVVRGSKLLLLDEPLSNLDAKLRVEMREELRTLQQQLGLTTIFVTHDQEEALSLSDRIAVMRNGKVLEIGAPEDLYLRPVHSFTAQFIGQAQLWPATVIDSRTATTPLGVVTIADAPLPSGPVDLFVRPEHLRLHPAGTPISSGNFVPAKVSRVSFSGKFAELEVLAAGQLVRVQTLAGAHHAAGDDVVLELPVEFGRLVAREDGAGASAPDGSENEAASGEPDAQTPVMAPVQVGS
jgi:iron(III) transport system ATP-binding protein